MSSLFGDTVVPNIEIFYKEHYLTKFNHQNTTHMSMMMDSKSLGVGFPALHVPFKTLGWCGSLDGLGWEKVVMRPATCDSKLS